MASSFIAAVSLRRRRVVSSSSNLLSFLLPPPPHRHNQLHPRPAIQKRFAYYSSSSIYSKFDVDVVDEESNNDHKVSNNWPKKEVSPPNVSHQKTLQIPALKTLFWDGRLCRARKLEGEDAACVKILLPGVDKDDIRVYHKQQQQHKILIQRLVVGSYSNYDLHWHSTSFILPRKCKSYYKMDQLWADMEDFVLRVFLPKIKDGEDETPGDEMLLKYMSLKNILYQACIEEDENALYMNIFLGLPGLRKENVKVSVKKGNDRAYLRIKMLQQPAVKVKDDDDDFKLSGSRFFLPKEAHRYKLDQVRAEIFKDGVLRVLLPKVKLLHAG